MIVVIIAGGSGTRLWPLSTPEYPKHLLKLVNERTLLQGAYDRASRLGDTIYVVTEISHAHLVREQLPELPSEAFLIEPARRGTAHCIIFALDVIARNHDHSEPIAFIHSDHFVRDIEGFTHSFTAASKISIENKEITLIGIEPTYPATSFGYIERGELIDAACNAYKVKSFKEKPDFALAREHVGSGNYLWNCGYFVGTVETFLSEMSRSSPELKASFDILAKIDKVGTNEYTDAYLALRVQVIDIALIEKAKSLAVVAASFDWMDIGSFKDLHGVVDCDEQGNYFHGEGIHAIEVENVYVRNEEEKPIAVIGLDNIIVINTPAGILVARKDVSYRTGEVAKALQVK